MGDLLGGLFMAVMFVLAVVGGMTLAKALPMKNDCERNLPRSDSCVMQFVPASGNAETGK